MNEPQCCDACVARWVEVHRGNAGIIGRQWAERAIAKIIAAGGELLPWPTYDDSERVRGQALKKMKPLAGADSRIRDALARVCAAAAAARYAELVAGVE
jgi:hypothetical protein